MKKKTVDFLILNRGQAKFVNPQNIENVIALSVREPHKPPVEYDFIPEDKILRMVFTDEDSYEDAKRIGQENLLITPDHARQILEFVFRDKNTELVICQCDGGICRSSAMAAALSVIIKGTGSDEQIFKVKNPNMLVYRTILLEAEKLNLV